MMYADILQVAAISGLFGLFLGGALIRLGRSIADWYRALLPPRYLKARGIRLVRPGKGDDHAR
ncbi:cellulose biosynthesis protein BcsF [Zobellella sp. DQSA1]|uniref:cellulose biosynthesis protein BcsF n=1 Tax=Zobellella sp. DQSA1 TaxID=3342386 RepID=UPI0035C01AE8